MNLVMLGDFHAVAGSQDVKSRIRVDVCTLVNDGIKCAEFGIKKESGDIVSVLPR